MLWSHNCSGQIPGCLREVRQTLQVGGFSLQLGVFSLLYTKKKITYLMASFHRFWLLPKAVQWVLHMKVSEC